MIARRDITTVIKVTKADLITALQMRFPGNIHLQAIPPTGIDVKLELSTETGGVQLTRKIEGAS